MSTSTWTPEREAALRRLWMDGHTAEAIARRMGGIGKGGISAAAHRLGLPRRAHAGAFVISPKVATAKKPTLAFVPGPRG
jgi:hypothetical protein